MQSIQQNTSGDLSKITVEVKSYDSFLQLKTSNQELLSFHYIWLRHNCPCCIHPLTKERIISPSDFSLEIKPRYIAWLSDEQALEIIWDSADGHTSRFSFDWLVRHNYSEKIIMDNPSERIDSLILQGNGSGPNEELLTELIRNLFEKKIIIVQNAGLDTEAWIAALKHHRLNLFNSHFGKIEDLRPDNQTNQNNDQLGYTNAAVDLHSDLPFIENTPLYQMLHCMRPAKTGGENFFVDASWAAEVLKKTDHQAFHLLTTTRVLFHRRQKNYESKVTAPILQYGIKSLEQIRYSYFTMDPFDLPFGKMLDWYRAYNQFARILHAPENQYRIKLGQGDLVLYDNWKVLHGRTGFEGDRWLRGVFFTF